MANARAKGADLQRTIATTDHLAGSHPVHAAYAYAQKQVSVMSEQITQLRALAPLAKILGPAEDTYMPSGPPMSPLTVSYFTCWAFFDACGGPAKETIGTILLELGAEFGMHPELLRLVGLMQKSRMGMFHHEGTQAGLAVLRDLVAGTAGRVAGVLPAHLQAKFSAGPRGGVRAASEARPYPALLERVCVRGLRQPSPRGHLPGRLSGCAGEPAAIGPVRSARQMSHGGAR